MGSNVVEIIIKATDQASKQLKGTEDSLEEFGKAAVQVTAGLVAFGFAAKKAFDLGREGAQINQTADSFDLLLEKVDAAPNLLNQLSAAANDTISDMDLMSSTATLLAGASGDLATELANATPRLLEIAKAANKLNPSLGTTTQMYNSIAVGVKRAQPLILDNLGLTIKVGEANQTLATALGKTVDELTAAEKSQAILNATLEAGDTLINQVGGTTDSATDSFDQLTTTLKNVTDELKAAAAVKFTPVVKSTNDMIEATKLLNDLVAAGVITKGESTRATYEAYYTDLTYLDLIERFTPLLEEYNNQMWEGEGAVRAVTSQQIVSNEVLDRSASVTDLYVQKGMEASEMLTTWERVTMNANKAGSLLNEQLQVSIGSYASLSRNVGSVTENLQKQINFLAAGGAAVSAMIQAAEDAINAGDLGLAQKLVDEATLGAIDVQLELDELTAEEAAEKIKNQFGVSLADARLKVEELQSTIFAMTESEYLFKFKIDVELPQNPYLQNLPTGGGGGTTGAGGIGDPYGSGGPVLNFNGTNINNGMDLEELAFFVAQRLSR